MVTLVLSLITLPSRYCFWMVTQDVREVAMMTTSIIFFIPAKLLHNQNIVAGLLPCLVKLLDARKGFVVLDSFYNSLSCEAQHFSIAGNGHYLLFHTANIGYGLQLTRNCMNFNEISCHIFPPHTKKTKENKREKRETPARGSPPHPVPVPHLPAAPLPPME